MDYDHRSGERHLRDDTAEDAVEGVGAYGTGGMAGICRGVKDKGMAERASAQAVGGEGRSEDGTGYRSGIGLGECACEDGTSSVGIDGFGDITHVEAESAPDDRAAGAGIGDMESDVADECALCFEGVDKEPFGVAEITAEPAAETIEVHGKVKVYGFMVYGFMGLMGPMGPINGCRCKDIS